MGKSSDLRNFGIPIFGFGGLIFLCVVVHILSAEEPPAINPFGPRTTEREDAVPGYIELSSGEIIVGKIYMTRDKRLKIYDSQLQRQREIPLNRVKQIESVVVSEKMEKEWRFKETTSDVKEYTGRTYPLREYVHRITLTDGRTIEGPLSEVIYIQPDPGTAAKTGSYRPEIEPIRYILYKTHKGSVDQDLKSLTYVKAIRLGQEAYQEGMKKTGGKGVSGPRPRGQ